MSSEMASMHSVRAWDGSRSFLAHAFWCLSARWVAWVGVYDLAVELQRGVTAFLF